MSTIVIHCTYTGPKGAARAFAEEMIASGLRDAVTGEDGCLQYDYYLSLRDAETVVLLERWRDAAALQAHMEGEPMRRLKALKARYGIDTAPERFECNE